MDSMQDLAFIYDTKDAALIALHGAQETVDRLRADLATQSHKHRVERIALNARIDELVALLKRAIRTPLHHRDSDGILRENLILTGDIQATLDSLNVIVVHYVRSEHPVCGAKFPTNYSRKSNDVTCPECRAQFDVFDRDQAKGVRR